MFTAFCTDVETYWEFWKYEDYGTVDQSNITLYILYLSYRVENRARISRLYESAQGVLKLLSVAVLCSRVTG